MKIKRTISLFLACISVICAFAFSSCSNSKESGFAVISMSADKAAPKPGEEFNITISVKNGKMFCYTDLFMEFNAEAVEYVSFESAAVNGLQSDVLPSAAGKLNYAAYVATTCDVTSDSLAVLTFRVLDGVSPGTDCSLKFSDECDYAIGEDAQGNNVIKVTENVEFNSCSVVVG